MDAVPPPTDMTSLTAPKISRILPKTGRKLTRHPVHPVSCEITQNKFAKNAPKNEKELERVHRTCRTHKKISKKE